MRKYRLKSKTAVVRLLLGVVLVFGCASFAQASTCSDLPGKIEAARNPPISDLRLANVTITSANVVPIDGVNVFHPYCEVLGYVTTSDPTPAQVKFDLGLPSDSNGEPLENPGPFGVDGWNFRYIFEGNGGFAGSLSQGSLPAATNFGFATVFTDTGHDSTAFGSFSFMDGSWALNNLGAQHDYLIAGVHVTAVPTQAITKIFYYGRDVGPNNGIFHSYFNGCSDGGREGLIEAQYYPFDFDAIIAGDPAVGRPDLGFNYYEQALLKSPDAYIPASVLPAIDQTILNQCDALDGVKDGLIQDPRRCALNTAALICGPSQSSNCITGRQLDTLLSIFRGPGQNIYPGLPMSDISGDDGWSQWVVGNTTPQFGVVEPWGAPPASFSTAPWDFSFQDQLLKYFVFSDPNYNSLSFRFNNADLGRYAGGPDTDASGLLHPDLSTFMTIGGPHRDGGKLLIYHGWSDPALAPTATIDYFNTILKQNGGDLQTLENSVRLFMVPGMHHCGGGPGPNNTNWFNPMFFWRDFDVQPDNIVLDHFQNNDPNTGIVTRSMPVCAYPETAKYDGSGDVNDASSWTCVAPGK